MEKCRKCQKVVKFILSHLKKSSECSKSYDMLSIIKRSKDAYKEKKREKYESQKEEIKQKRRDRYKNNAEHEKQKRMDRYEDNAEHEKQKRRDHYKDNAEYEKQYNKNYHRLNREVILPKMREYNKSYRPIRSAVNKFKKRIVETPDGFGHCYNRWYLEKAAFHMYYHTLGICDINTVVHAKHRIAELSEKCTACDDRLYAIAGQNKLNCMNVECRQTICRLCMRIVSADPQEDFKHFYIHSGIMPGMCPLFEDFDSLRSSHQCSDKKPCFQTEPDVIKLDDYGLRDCSNLPTVHCEKCKEVKTENPSLLDRCLKIQKFGFGPREGKSYCLGYWYWTVTTGKKLCKRTGSELSQDNSLTFYKDKEFHFLNCYICGWTENENNLRRAAVWKSGEQQMVNYKIPISVDQRIFYVDQPDDPGRCCFGNLQNYDKGDGYRNFEHLCSLNEHILDHQPEGKSCLTIEIKLKENVDNKTAKDYFNAELAGLDNIHTLLGIEDIFESCENFRVQHGAKYEFQEKKVNNLADHRKYVDSNYEWMLKPCNMFKLGQCSDTNIIVVYLILKRNSTTKNIFELFNESEFIFEWMLSFQEPMSDFLNSPTRYHRCHCKKKEGKQIGNPICPVFSRTRNDNQIEEFEHVQDCRLQGDRKEMKQELGGVELLNKNMVNHFLPQFKKMLKYCKCEGSICLGEAKGWNCQNCNNQYCEMGKFTYWGKEFDEGHPYCISYDQGKQILEYSSNNDSSESDSDSESESESTDTEVEEITENTSDEDSNSDSS